METNLVLYVFETGANFYVLGIGPILRLLRVDINQLKL